MRKLSLLTGLLIGLIGQLAATNNAAPNLTYSVQAQVFPTDFGNQFAYYHVNLDLGDVTRVAKNGNLQIHIEFQKGMEVSKTQFERKPNGAVYYVTNIVTPVFRAIVSDPSGNQLLDKAYGGVDKAYDFGKEKSYPESELAAKWLNEKDAFMQKIEFQNLDFTDLELDLIDLLDKAPIVIPVKEVAKPKRPEKVKLPATPKATTNTDVIIPTDEGHTTEDPENVTVNPEAAAQEETVLKDPFAELNEPVEAKQNTPQAAPVDYEAKAKKQKRKDKKESAMPEEAPEKVTPVLSDRRNIVKLNLPNLSFGNITLNYERLLSAKNSVALNVGFLPAKSSPSWLNDVVDANEATTATFRSLTATVEYRMYGNKKGAGRGFYFAPYLRYADHEFNFDSVIEGNYTNADTKLSAVGVGGQIGIQWLIKDRIAIDWGILGLAAQWYNFKSTFQAVEQEVNFDEIRAELESEIEDSPLTNKLEFTSTDDALEAKMPFLFGGARAYLSVGYKF